MGLSGLHGQLSFLGVTRGNARLQLSSPCSVRNTQDREEVEDAITSLSTVFSFQSDLTVQHVNLVHSGVTLATLFLILEQFYPFPHHPPSPRPTPPKAGHLLLSPFCGGKIGVGETTVLALPTPSSPMA